MQRQRFAGHDLSLGDGRLHVEAEAGLQDAVELRAFVGDERVSGQSRELGANRQQSGNRSGGIIELKLGERVGGEPADLSAAGNAVPSEIDAVHQIGRGHLAPE